MMFSISDSILTVNGLKNDFRHNISNVIEVDGILIVHLFDSIEKKGSINIKDQPLNNIYAVDQNGKIIWNIKDIIPNDDLYTGINIDSNGSLIANTFMGIAKIIDIRNKNVIGTKVTK